MDTWHILLYSTLSAGTLADMGIVKKREQIQSGANLTWSLAIYMLHLHAVHAWSWFLELLLVQVPVKIQTSRAVQNLTDQWATLCVTHLPVCHIITWNTHATNLHSHRFHNCLCLYLIQTLQEMLLTDLVGTTLWIETSNTDAYLLLGHEK